MATATRSTQSSAATTPRRAGPSAAASKVVWSAIGPPRSSTSISIWERLRPSQRQHRTRRPRWPSIPASPTTSCASASTTNLTQTKSGPITDRTLVVNAIGGSHQNLIMSHYDIVLPANEMWMRPVEMELWQMQRRPVRALRGLWWSRAAMLRGASIIALLIVPLPALAQDSVVGTAALPRDLSPWGMYLNADPVVKAVLMGLAFASIVTWTVWLAKTIEIFFAKRRVREALNKLVHVRSTADGVERLADSRGEVMQFLDAAVTELKVSSGSTDREGIKERIASRLARIEASYGRRILRGTGVLATIGATAPFVGLFGTVWGIMNSFIGISKSHTTNLAVVAPGIAEALLATAFGLAAAIPAVVIYNVFARSIAGYRAGLGDAAAEVLRLVSRDLERAVVPAPSARRASPLCAVERT